MILRNSPPSPFGRKDQHRGEKDRGLTPPWTVRNRPASLCGAKHPEHDAAMRHRAISDAND
jgi:hypothetical protein